MIYVDPVVVAICAETRGVSGADVRQSRKAAFKAEAFQTLPFMGSPPWLPFNILRIYKSLNFNPFRICYSGKYFYTLFDFFTSFIGLFFLLCYTRHRKVVRKCLEIQNKLARKRQQQLQKFYGTGVPVKTQRRLREVR